MSALELISFLTQAIYVLIFFFVLVRTIRQPTPADVDMTLFFGSLATIVVLARVATLIGASGRIWFVVVVIGLLMAVPYFLLRLVDDFRHVPPLAKRATELGLVASVVAVYATAPALPPPLALVLVAFFFVVSVYCAAFFIGASRTARGVTRRRMEAISLGAIMLGSDLLVSGLTAFLPEPDRGLLNAFGQLLGLGSAIAFYIGFAPPGLLRRAWQSPDLRGFLARASQLPRLPTTRDIVRELETSAAAIAGAGASIALWQDDTGKLRFWIENDQVSDIDAGTHFAGRAFELQRPVFSADPVRENPEAAELYLRRHVGAVIAVPITAGERRLGVLTLFAERAPIFATSDIELASLLADQAAVILESRALIDHAAEVRAQEEATRLKEDFLSAAAHDLRTPLTTVVAQAEFLERKALREPAAPADIVGIRRIVREGKRLAAQVADLLDANRLDRGKLVTDREPVDLATIVRDVCERGAEGRRLHLELSDPVIGVWDRRRVEQLLQNLLENARKYSPDQEPIAVMVWQENGEARLTVKDHGIGIPAADLPRVFDRFARASNVDDRRFHGMGLGLFICRGIVEEHGGRIWAESEVGKGSTFHVALPMAHEGRLN